MVVIKLILELFDSGFFVALDLFLYFQSDIAFRQKRNPELKRSEEYKQLIRELREIRVSIYLVKKRLKPETTKEKNCNPLDNVFDRNDEDMIQSSIKSKKRSKSETF